MIADGNLKKIYQLLHQKASFLTIHQKALPDKPDASAELTRLRSLIHDDMKYHMHNQFPSEEFLTAQDEAPKGNDYYWRFYPINETDNFLRLSSQWTLAISGHWKQRLHKVLIVEGSRNNYYWARRNGGCYSKFTRLRVSETSQLPQAVMACDIGKDKSPAAGHHNYYRILNNGSLLLNATLCASGIADIFSATETSPLLQLAALLIEEAGGLVCDRTGQPFNEHSDDILATNPPLLPLLLKQRLG